MYLVRVSRPRRSATWAHTVLTENVSAVVRSMAPKLWLLSFDRGTPEMVFGESPLTVEFGVNMPLSIAATAVTTLNVEPGGYRPWTERFKVEMLDPVASGLLLS